MAVDVELGVPVVMSVRLAGFSSGMGSPHALPLLVVDRDDVPMAAGVSLDLELRALGVAVPLPLLLAFLEVAGAAGGIDWPTELADCRAGLVDCRAGLVD